MSQSINAALDNAWSKIQNYCKEKYKGKTVRDVQFQVYHDMYMWMEFGVTSNGDAYFVRGDHSMSHTSDRADWYYHPGHKEGYFALKYRELETIVRKWTEIKVMLAKKFAQEESIFNFEV